MRVQIFWCLAGISNKVCNRYWSHRLENLNWLRNTISIICTSLKGQNETESDINLVKECWVESQSKYYNNTIEKYKSRHKILSKAEFICTIIAFIYLLLLIPALYAIKEERVDPIIIEHLILVFSLPGPFALWCYLSNRLNSYESLAKRYTKIVPIYQQVQNALKKIDEQKVCPSSQSNQSSDTKDSDISRNPDEQRKMILRYLGDAALAENADWFLMTRKLDLPR